VVGIELVGPLRDDRPSDGYHLGIEFSLSAGELCCPNLVGSAQGEQGHSGTASLDHYHPLAPVQRKTPKPDNTCLGHRRADHSQRFDGDRAIGIKIIRALEVDGIEFTARHKLLQVDDLGAFDIQGLQLVCGERDELAALIFVSKP
jgi:hypothetical protein